MTVGIVGVRAISMAYEANKNPPRCRRLRQRVAHAASMWGVVEGVRASE